MTLPASFKKAGFLSADAVRPVRRVMVSIDGPQNTGKTEFALGAPGPGIVLGLDRGFDALLDNPDPPPTRRDDFAFKVIKVPKATQMAQADFLAYWKAYYADLKTASEMAECRTLVLDGDSDSWELQRLTEFGRLAKVPPHLYDNVNAARRALYSRLYDCSKIIIATNKIKKTYIDKVKADGTVEMDPNNRPVQVWNGEYERQGFRDQGYVWAIQLRSMYSENKGFGMKIVECKANMSLRGYELWDDECNFPKLLETVYPHIPLDEWGY